MKKKNTRNPFTLRKSCSCPPARWHRCEPTHSWELVKRRGPRGRLWLSLNRYQQAKGRPIVTLTKSQAEEIALEILAEDRAGTLDATLKLRGFAAPVAQGLGAGESGSPQQQAPDATFAEAADRVIKRARARNKIHDQSRVYRAERLKVCRPDADRPPVGEWRVSSLGSDDIEQIFMAVTAGCAEGPRGNSSRRKYRSVLKAILTEAVKAGFILASPITTDTESLPKVLVY